MSGSAFIVARLRLVANEPLLGIHAVSVYWWGFVSGICRAISELLSNFCLSERLLGSSVASLECSFILPVTDQGISPMYIVVQSLTVYKPIGVRNIQ